MANINWETAKEYKEITFKVADGVARIAINRPEVRNAFTPLTVDEMLDALILCHESNEIGVVLITGEGPSPKDGGWAFCSGGDQRVRAKRGYAYANGNNKFNILDVQRQIRFMNKVVIAMVPGWCVGGGHSLHVVCDMTLASKEHAVFKQTDADVASFDGGFGSAYLARQVGQKRAREIFFLGLDYSAQEAYEMGMVNKVVPLTDLESSVMEMAEKIASFIQERGGFITTEDLANYEAVWRQPVIFNYKDLRIISMSPPSSGGVTMHQIFKMIEPYDIKSFGHNSPEAIQLFTEASRRAYADRNFFLGDPDYSPITLDVILSNAYLKKRMTNFSFDKATLSSEVSHGDVQIIESEETTHYSIVDQDGNAVSVTTTLNGAFGSKLYSEELGFFFNNEMDDFSAKAGVPNMFGLIGAEANSIEPGKRMLSSMTPTIVEKEGKLWMVVGTPGGSTIITAVAQTILNAYEHGLSMQDAVNAPRFHHQWLPDTVVFEPEGFSKSTLATLKEKGYLINEERSRIIGKVDAIRVLKSGQLEAGADPRGDDAAVGF